MEYSRYFQRTYPSQANSHKGWTFQPKLSLSSRFSSKHSEVQQCSLTQWLCNQTSCTCAALQQSSRGAAQRSSRHAAAAGKLRSIPLVCALHNTITLTLTAVRAAKFLHSIEWMFTYSLNRVNVQHQNHSLNRVNSSSSCLGPIARPMLGACPSHSEATACLHSPIIRCPHCT